jgi:hypothetical protein
MPLRCLYNLCNTFALRLQCLRDAIAMPSRCDCNAFELRLQYVRIAVTILLHRVHIAFALRWQCDCNAFALNLQCFCITSAQRLHCGCARYTLFRLYCIHCIVDGLYGAFALHCVCVPLRCVWIQVYLNDLQILCCDNSM